MTRSTKDFCEFDERMKKLGIGFTSVSEPFVDTSSPMGELVVNLIVSFGQWERKTIQERIRRHFQTALDQGYFVGGVPPYGYRVENQNLVPDPATAENVPRIFRLFVQLKSAKKVAARLAEEGIERFPGRAWTLQSVRNCLRNVRYVGDANSHGKVVRGRQRPLLTRDLWEQAQRLMKPASASKAERTVSPESTLFHGIVWCGHCGRPMSYRWSKKNSVGIRKYSYFVCQRDFRKAMSECPVRHVSVTTVQDAIERELESVMLASTTMLVAAANATSFTPEQIVAGFRRHAFWQGMSSKDRLTVYRLFVSRVTIFETAVELRLNLPVPGAADELEKARYVSTDAKDAGNARIDEDGLLSVRVPVAFRTVSGRKRIVKDGDGAAKAKPTRRELDETLAQGVVLKSFAKALAWMRLIDEGKAASASQLAEIVGVDRSYVLHTLRLATLSPRIVRAALKGELPDGFSLQKVRKIETDDWEEQERLLGFPPAT